MTSNDTPRPGARAGRRRALGRGPGERVAPPVPRRPEAPRAPDAVPSADEPPGPAVARAASGQPPDTTVSAPSSWDDATSAAASPTAPEPEAEDSRPKAGPRDEPETAPASPRPEPVPQPPAVAPAPAVVPGSGPQASVVAPEAPGAAHGPAGRESVAWGAPEPAVAAVDGETASASSGSGASTGPPGGGAERPPKVAEASPVHPEGVPDDGGDGVFKVRLANFEGPFDLLLQLISKHKMDVTEVALSKVTDEFMAHIRARGPDWDLDETTEFLVVAATLLDLKAARLLPAAEVEDEADLALLEARDLLFARLLQYRAYKQIAEIFNERLEAEARRHPRTVGLEPHHAELLPEVVISIGPEGFAKLAVKAMQPRPKPQVYVEHIHAPLVSVQEQAGIVVARLKELGEASFRLLVEDTDDTLTVVARFLALLELYREKAVELDQETALGDLLVRWTGGDGDTEPVVTDEFDRPPEKTEEERKA
ncbi:segregation/condensation protein A [Streptomyces sp. DH41]|nr:segregation/condensation protein A [Streptomyces sp. DH41]MDG9725662.1 segregation/condensation protein A [Streptomyces sp. DH41]